MGIGLLASPLAPGDADCSDSRERSVTSVVTRPRRQTRTAEAVRDAARAVLPLTEATVNRMLSGLRDLTVVAAVPGGPGFATFSLGRHRGTGLVEVRHGG
jgi:hypothetical protein